MNRIGIYGGSFDPIHRGHLSAAKQAAELLRLDKLLMIPAHTAPHKTSPEGSAAPEQRLEMVRLACRDEQVLAASDLELARGGVSYTWETVEQVRSQYPEAEIFLLMGGDMFLSFQSWKHPEKILENAALAVFCRGGRNESADISAKKEEMEARGHKIHLIPNDVVDISSTQLRRLLAFRCGSEFLPDGVDTYIYQNRLYNTDPHWQNLPMEELERVVTGLLKPNRVAHVLGCRDTAVELAKRWGADETDAARAGMLHDVTKALDGPLQLTLCRDYGMILSDFSRKNPKTLHALTGSLVAQRIFGENKAVVEAIRHHTTGKGNMNVLEKIIYVADYMEPNRDFPGVERLRELAFSDLDEALYLGLTMTLALLNKQGSEVSPESREALAWLETKGKCKC